MSECVREDVGTCKNLTLGLEQIQINVFHIMRSFGILVYRKLVIFVYMRYMRFT